MTLLGERLPTRLILGWSRPHEEIILLMIACDALIVTSLQEGSPTIVKEALACDLPIVSVVVGDVAERLRGIEGCEIATDDRAATLADALERVLKHEENRWPSRGRATRRESSRPKIDRDLSFGARPNSSQLAAQLERGRRPTTVRCARARHVEHTYARASRARHHVQLEMRRGGLSGSYCWNSGAPERVVRAPRRRLGLRIGDCGRPSPATERRATG